MQVDRILTYPADPLGIGMLVSRKDAAHYLGVSEQTLASWKSSGRYNLPFVKIGRLVKYRKEDLDAFISRNLRAASQIPNA